MRTHLTGRDAIATVFAVFIGVVTFAVLNEWDWPLLGSFTAASLVVLLLAVPMCAVGGNAFWDSVAFQHPLRAFHDPFLAASMLLAPAAVAVVIGALIAGTQAWFIALVAIIGVKWLVATTRHAVETEPRLGAHALVLHG